MKTTIQATCVTDEELVIENKTMELGKLLDDYYGLNNEMYDVIVNAVSHHVDDLPMCGYCGDKYPVVGQEVCSKCLVEVSDEELEEMGLL